MISVTTLSSYLYCKRKLYLNNVLGIREPINAALVRGKIRHSAHEEIGKKEELIVKSIEEQNFEDILTLYQQEHLNLLKNIFIKNSKLIDSVDINKHFLFNEISRFILEESKARAERIFNLIETEKVFGEELWLKVIPKSKQEFRIESINLGLKGVIDRIDVYPEKIVPVELKTGTAPLQGVWGSHRIQLGAYCMLLEEHFNTSIKEGVVVYLDSRKEVPVVMNPYLKEDIIQMTESVKCLLNTPDIPLIEKNQNKCKNCGLRECCFNEKLIKNSVKGAFTSPQ